MDRYPSSGDLVRALRDHAAAGGVVDRLKTQYRPYICPFDDLLTLLPTAGTVFDIGCGNGAFLLLTALFRHPTALGGVEINPRLIENARNLLRNAATKMPVDLRVYDGVTLPAEVRDYQWVFLIDVLHHVPRSRQSAFLAQIRDKMSPGATLVVKEIDAAHRVLCACNKLHDLLLSGEIGHELEAAATERELAALGFRINAVRARRVLFYPHYTVVATRS